MSRPGREVSILRYLFQRKQEKTFPVTKCLCSVVSLRRILKKLYSLLYLYTRFLKFLKQASQSSFPLRKALQISLSKGFILMDGSQMSPKDKPYGPQARSHQHRISILPRNSSFETKPQSRIFRKRDISPIVKFCKKATSTIIFNPLITKIS